MANIDLYSNEFGDILVSNGDFVSTSENEERTYIQQVIARMLSYPGDWTVYPWLGAGLSSYHGRLNTRETARDMESDITRALTEDGLIPKVALTVKVVPLTHTSVGVFIKIKGITNALAFMFNLEDGEIKLN